jgi:hypothetical protein
MESVREGYRSVREVYMSVREGSRWYSYQPESIRGQCGSVWVGYWKYGRLQVDATLGN